MFLGTSKYNLEDINEKSHHHLSFWNISVFGQNSKHNDKYQVFLIVPNIIAAVKCGGGIMLPSRNGSVIGVWKWRKPAQEYSGAQQQLS